VEVANLPMALGSDLLWVHPKDNTDSRDPFTIQIKVKKKPKCCTLYESIQTI